MTISLGNDMMPYSRQSITWAKDEQVLRRHMPSPDRSVFNAPESKVHEANMGPICGRQDPGGPHVGPMNFAIWGIRAETRWTPFSRRHFQMHFMYENV